MTFLPNGSVLFTEKSGILTLFKDGKKQLISNTPKVYLRGQSGLLDIELHPDYLTNGWIYISYVSEEGEGKGGHTAIMRAKLKGNALVENKLLYKASPNTTKGQHFGSRIVFDDEGFLYFSIGERGERDLNPQDITRDGGKIYRLKDDGSIPLDNPFVGVKNAKKAIYSYGHRNPQGMIKNPITGDIWIHEHGPRGGDELNKIKKGANYGWPVITYGINYSGTSITDETAKEGMEQPMHYWTPSIAPSGMTYVDSKKYPDWKGSLLVGSLAFQYLERLEMKDEKVINREKLMDGLGRVRNVKQAPDGYIYVSIEGKGIYKLIPNKATNVLSLNLKMKKFLQLFFSSISLILITLPSLYAQDNQKAKEIRSGLKLYQKNCVICHGKNGTGKGKRIPPLAKSDYLLNQTEESIRGIKFGFEGEITVNGIVYNKVMKPSKLTDAEIAEVLNYILNSWGNTTAKVITQTDVSKKNKHYCCASIAFLTEPCFFSSCSAVA